jgi:hypothetical protein
MVTAVTREAEIIEAMHEKWRARSAAEQVWHDCQTLVRRLMTPDSAVPAVGIRRCVAAVGERLANYQRSSLGARELNVPGETRRARAGTNPRRIQGWIRLLPITGVQSWQFDGNR